MICIDTSVWIEFFRDKNSSITSEVIELLDGGEVALPVPVWIELLAGAPKKERDKLKKLLSAIPCFYPTRSTWKLMENWTRVAVSKGQRFGVRDLLIAAIAVENNSRIWSLDTDFERMKKLKFY